VSASTVVAPAAALVDPVETAAVPAVATAAATPLHAVSTRPHVRAVNVSTLGTIWRRSDTRSLQQAFTSLRRETLAFHRCGMQVTGANQAVARCDGVANATGGDLGAGRRVTWTIDFRRTGDRWAIQRVTSR
jgi:hypothetical protein